MADNKMKNRTGVDFSKHELNIIKDNNCTIHDLKKPGSDYCQRIKFINTCGVLVVTGDYGNWIFCREFHPSKKEKVSDHYWIEKAQINSTQKPTEFDSNATDTYIQQGIASDLEEYGYGGDKLEEMKKYYTDLLDYVHLSEWEYISYAYNNYPSFVDVEQVPFVKSTNIQLQVVFDAFDEICDRVEN